MGIIPKYGVSAPLRLISLTKCAEILRDGIKIYYPTHAPELVETYLEYAQQQAYYFLPLAQKLLYSSPPAVTY